MPSIHLRIPIEPLHPIIGEFGIRIALIYGLSCPKEGVLGGVADLTRLVCGNRPLDIVPLSWRLRYFEGRSQRLYPLLYRVFPRLAVSARC
jgi:hypothetical protein